jgi:hypothetical protein
MNRNSVDTKCRGKSGTYDDHHHDNHFGGDDDDLISGTYETFVKKNGRAFRKTPATSPLREFWVLTRTRGDPEILEFYRYSKAKGAIPVFSSFRATLFKTKSEAARANIKGFYPVKVYR